MGPDHLKDLNPTDLWHVDVKQHNVGPRRLDQVEGDCRIRGRFELVVSGPFEQLADDMMIDINLDSENRASESEKN